MYKRNEKRQHTGASAAKNPVKYYAIYKPYGMMPSFTGEPGQSVLGDLYNFPKDVYPIGRLDMDSEGLLVLTNDKKLNSLVLSPANKHARKYLVQVEGIPDEEAINKMAAGVEITLKNGKYQTLPAKVRAIAEPEFLPDRLVPVRFRANIPTSWLELELIEGKNRQVRKTTAAVGHPTLRLVRFSIEDLSLRILNGSPIMQFTRREMYKLLKLDQYLR